MDMREIDTAKDWDALADRVRAPLPQRWLYGAAAERIGRQTRRFCLYDEERPVAIAQVVIRPLWKVQMSLITRGPLFLERCDRKAVVKTLKRALPFGVKLMSPEETLGGIKLSVAPELAELDLTRDLDTLRAGLDGKWRNALKKAEATRLRVARLQPSPQVMMPLLKAEKDRQSEGRYRGLPPEFTLAIQDVAPKSLRLFEAGDAQMLFVLHGNSATYQIGHTGPEGRKANAHNLILWEAMKRLKAEGVLRLDLGTLDRDKAADLARFKLRTGANARTLGPASLM